ncbi:MAG: hypothetical protein A2887_03835 [Alphaproteobacteria bacterium RIFCSPLOWO2_01_FULL_40_26]|nr:MAG: hypothetical protein A3D15_04990 [Alphaproteobacteria bacterium RIFCSPHIGHO2_02_FULL_40_34]OFW89020.1 MAG: hypothetical protein A2794_02655 [Alphaproteobacteria bacterium RIFCSPHIGHO2_01_FULL_40_8]OFW95328.1 MAG: hypothetical protein A2887_03835 [Alphaproteobacteria bacterium RIFCSPLOWO2_01_FULL_40_26]OFX09231.1 MAG: hypothetical protein A3H30_06540 [Alphaproteobacteria bacterium RIFCSPLOWO2_02_FULL_40_19]OFX11586.1 MAG: hypothetical protein A3G22_05145 [Alphaproteobacteria bacterium RI
MLLKAKVDQSTLAFQSINFFQKYFAGSGLRDSLFGITIFPVLFRKFLLIFSKNFLQYVNTAAKFFKKVAKNLRKITKKIIS